MLFCRMPRLPNAYFPQQKESWKMFFIQMLINPHQHIHTEIYAKNQTFDRIHIAKSEIKIQNHENKSN